MISTLFGMLVVIGIICILYWGWSKLEPMLPQSGPVKVIIIIFTVIVAIWLLLWLATMFVPSFHFPR